ncbi:MAG TPA: hypothetical protein VFU02_19100, partial [Polyangiaceae bacterium]|nr:hypothetical protein [Polyangiaceae bacterium]
MQPPPSLHQRAGWVLVVTSLASPALAAEQPCTGVTVTAHPGVVGRWPTLPERVRNAVAERSDIDHCARAHLGTSGETITLEVILDDGRSTIRELSAAEDVVPALEALLLVPPREAVETSGAVETVRPPHDAEKKLGRRSSPTRPPAMSEHDAAVPAERGELAQPEAGVGFLFSIGGGARTGDGQTSGNLGAMALLNLSGWLVGLDGRAVTYEVPPSDGIPQSAAELTAVAGYRF